MELSEKRTKVPFVLGGSTNAPQNQWAQKQKGYWCNPSTLMFKKLTNSIISAKLKLFEKFSKIKIENLRIHYLICGYTKGSDGLIWDTCMFFKYII